MAPIGDAVDFKIVHRDMAKLEPRWVQASSWMRQPSEHLQGSSLRGRFGEKIGQIFLRIPERAEHGAGSEQMATGAGTQ